MDIEGEFDIGQFRRRGAHCPIYCIECRQCSRSVIVVCHFVRVDHVELVVVDLRLHHAISSPFHIGLVLSNLARHIPAMVHRAVNLSVQIGKGKIALLFGQAVVATMFLVVKHPSVLRGLQVGRRRSRGRTLQVLVRSVAVDVLGGVLEIVLREFRRSLRRRPQDQGSGYQEEQRAPERDRPHDDGSQTHSSLAQSHSLMLSTRSKACLGRY